MRGSNLLNYAKFEGFLKDEKGRITGVEIQDKVSGKKLRVRSKAVVNAAGVFGDAVRKIDDPLAGRRIMFALGSHASIPAEYCSRDMGLLIPKTSDGRVLFVLPWLNTTILGTTDYLTDEAVIHPVATPECTNLCYEGSKFFAKETGLIYPSFRDKNVDEFIQSKWAGIRPLVSPTDLPEVKTKESASGKKFARTHLIMTSASGLVSVMGGKWTIYRRMGEETVLEVKKWLQPSLNHTVAGLKGTRSLRLVGDFRGTIGKPVKLDAKLDHHGYLVGFVKGLYQKHSSLGLPLINHLARTYGVRSLDIIDMIGADPKLVAKVSPKFEVTKAEVLYQIRNEMVVNVFDLLLRRNRFAFIDRVAAKECIPILIDILGDELKWDVQTKQANHKESLEIFEKMQF
jgi:glycerol-3-phosphate dehydrogenase